MQKWHQIHCNAFEMSDNKLRTCLLTCNFRTEGCTEPCETSKMEFIVKMFNGLNCYIHKKVPSWQGLEYASAEAATWEVFWKIGVLKIWSQNTWKIPMKKFIFIKVAGWQSATFSGIPWGFYLIKKFAKIVFFIGFFFR